MVRFKSTIFKYVHQPFNFLSHFTPASMKLLFTFLSVLTLFVGTYAQSITHGPVVGGVTPTSARIYVRTTEATPIEIELSTDTAFTTVITVNASTIAANDSSCIADIAGLQAYTEYYYRVKINGTVDSLKGHFRTFPTPGQRDRYDWVVLSCQEYGTYNTFDAIMQHQPLLTLHTGDWTYPDYQIPGDERLDWDDIKLSYRRRYNEPKMPQLLRSTVMDYVTDNHDGAYGHYNNSYPTASFDSATNTVTNNVVFEPIPPQAYQNIMDAYDTYFPGYEVEVPGFGMYHSYTFGNAEVFFVDVRHCGTGLDSTFRFNTSTNLWEMQPGGSILGQQQMDWLKQGLATSTADWKFIVSGVMFNRKFRKVLEVAMALQQIQVSIGGQAGTGFRLAHSLAWNWAGYANEQDAFLAYLSDNGIKDVIVLSGHVHTNVMDDGTNAGLPELNTGPVASTGPELTYYIDSFMQMLGYGSAIDSLWNGGGHGVENNNYKSGFGKIEIYGNDSVVLRTIDEDNFVVSSMVIPHSSKVTSVPTYEPEPECVIGNIFPNPAGTFFNLQLCDSYEPRAADKAFLIDISGKVTHITLSQNKLSKIDVSQLPVGNYLFVYDYGQSVVTTPVSVVR